MNFPGFLILFTFLLSSYLFAQRCGRGTHGQWILFLLTQAVLSVEGLGAFHVLNKSSLLAVGVGFLLLACFIERFYPRVNMPQKVNVSDLWRVLVGGILVAGVVLLNALIPVSEIDSIGYHLPIVSQLLRTGSVWDVFQAGFVGPNTYFPANHEALQAFLALVTGNYQLNFLVTLLAFVLFFQSIQSFRKNTFRSTQFIVVMAITTTPFLLQQFLNFQVDLFLFSLFGAMLAYLVSAILNNSKSDLLNFALIFGLALGTKYNALIQGVVFLPLMGYAIFLFRKEWKSLWWYPFLTVLSGGFWYVRNFFLTGNPIYPFQLKIGFIDFEGHAKFLSDMVGTSISHAVGQFGWSEVIHTIFSNKDFSQLGIPSLLMILLAVIVASAFCFLKKGRNPRLVIVYVLLILLFFLEIGAYVTSPYTYTLWNETIRYAAPLFSVVLILLLLIAEKSKLWAVILSVLGALLIVYNFFGGGFFANASYVRLMSEKLTEVSLLHLFVLLVSILVLCFSVWKLRVYSVLVVSLALVLNGNLYFSDTQKDDEFLLAELGDYKTVFPQIQELRTLRSNGKNRVALAGSTFYYLFEKEGFVPLYVNVDGCETCEYPDYRGLDQSVRSKPDQKAWEALLKKLNVDYLLVGINNYHSAGTDLFEEQWAENNSQMFVKLLSANGLTLYQIN